MYKYFTYGKMTILYQMNIIGVYLQFLFYERLRNMKNTTCYKESGVREPVVSSARKKSLISDFIAEVSAT